MGNNFSCGNKVIKVGTTAIGSEGGKTELDAIPFKNDTGPGRLPCKLKPSRNQRLFCFHFSFPAEVACVIVSHTHYVKARINQILNRGFRAPEHITHVGVATSLRN